MLPRYAWFALTLIVGFQASSLCAQQTSDQQKIEELERKIEELDRRLSIAEGKTAKTEAVAAAPAVQPAPASQTGAQRPTNAGVAAGTIPASEASSTGLVTAGPGGFAIRSAGGGHGLQIGGAPQS